MKRIHALLIKNECIKYAADNEMVIVKLDDDFIAEGSDSVIHVPISFLYDKLSEGWTVLDVLSSEVCFKEAV